MVRDLVMEALSPECRKHGDNEARMLLGTPIAAAQLARRHDQGG